MTITMMRLTGEHGHSEHGGDVDGLDVEELHGVDGRHREGSGLLVCVVELVEVLKNNVDDTLIIKLESSVEQKVFVKIKSILQIKISFP